MPFLNVDQSKSVIVLKRSMNSGFAGIDNPLFYADTTTTMLFGDAEESVTEVADELKALLCLSIFSSFCFFSSSTVG